MQLDWASPQLASAEPHSRSDDPLQSSCGLSSILVVAERLQKEHLLCQGTPNSAYLWDEAVLGQFSALRETKTLNSWLKHANTLAFNMQSAGQFDRNFGVFFPFDEFGFGDAGWQNHGINFCTNRVCGCPGTEFLIS